MQTRLYCAQSPIPKLANLIDNKVVDAIEFGKYSKLLLQVQNSMESTSKRNAFIVLMEEAGKLVCLDKIEIIRKNNKLKLYNDIIDLLQKNKLEGYGTTTR